MSNLCEWDSEEDGERDPNGCRALATEAVGDIEDGQWMLCAKHAEEAHALNRELCFVRAAKVTSFS